MQPEFTGSETKLVAGSVYGLRAFRVPFGLDMLTRENGGLLTSPLRQDTVWGPGEMVAKCDPGPGWLYYEPFGLKSDHRPASISCNCGFYAYHEPECAEEYMNVPLYSILGVIEAYGLITVGTRGFRAEKARIVGLVAPKSGFLFKRPHMPHRKVVKSYPDASLFGTVAQAAEAFNINGRPNIGEAE